MAEVLCALGIDPYFEHHARHVRPPMWRRKAWLGALAALALVSLGFVGAARAQTEATDDSAAAATEPAAPGADRGVGSKSVHKSPKTAATRHSVHHPARAKAPSKHMAKAQPKHTRAKAGARPTVKASASSKHAVKTKRQHAPKARTSGARPADPPRGTSAMDVGQGERGVS